MDVQRRQDNETTAHSRSLGRWTHVAVGVGVWLTCAACSATIEARFDEPLVLRLMRRWAEHPIRVVAAGTLATWALGGLVTGMPAAVPSSGGGVESK